MAVQQVVAGQVEHAAEAHGPDHLLVLRRQPFDDAANRHHGEPAMHSDDITVITVLLQRRRAGDGSIDGAVTPRRAPP